MFAYIKGTLSFIGPVYVIIESYGIGYKIYIPASTFSQLRQTESIVNLHTSLVIREFSQTLYGFLSTRERDLFEMLIDVTGIGPKTALSLIGHLPLPDLQYAVANQDIVTLCKVPGIGKKTAERLIIEMRDKLPGLFPHSGDESQTFIPGDPKSQKIHDAMKALINLGYNQATAQKAIKKTLKDDDSDEIDLAVLISTTLKNM